MRITFVTPPARRRRRRFVLSLAATTTVIVSAGANADSWVTFAAASPSGTASITAGAHSDAWVSFTAASPSGTASITAGLHSDGWVTAAAHTVEIGGSQFGNDYTVSTPAVAWVNSPAPASVGGSYSLLAGAHSDAWVSFTAASPSGTASVSAGLHSDGWVTSAVASITATGAGDLSFAAGRHSDAWVTAATATVSTTSAVSITAGLHSDAWVTAAAATVSATFAVSITAGRHADAWVTAASATVILAAAETTITPRPGSAWVGYFDAGACIKTRRVFFDPDGDWGFFDWTEQICLQRRTLEGTVTATHCCVDALKRATDGSQQGTGGESVSLSSAARWHLRASQCPVVPRRGDRIISTYHGTWEVVEASIETLGTRYACKARQIEVA